MIETVFILGAGASVDAGAPVMNNFIDTSEDLLRESAFGPDSNSIEKVFELIAKLQGVYSKSALDINNIESLFGTIEMARIIKKLDDYTEKEIEDLRSHLVLMIVSTLEKKMKFYSSDSPDSPFHFKSSYFNFATLLKEKKQFVNKSAIITFNYDIGIDFACMQSDIGIDYCLNPQTISDFHGILLLKLHGSTHWGRCSECKKIIPYPLGNFLQQNLPTNIENALQYQSLEVSKCFEGMLQVVSHEHKNFETLPVIVPPTWNKTEYSDSLTNVWNAAAQCLSQAQNIYVIGYSMPETDAFFKYLFALGTMSSARIRRFWVFNPDTKVEARYQRLIGRGIADRFRFFPLSFKEALKELNS